jgi:DNA-directed RNA polymerase subunit K
MEKRPFPKERYSKYELARILGARALQLSFNAPILIKIDKETLEDIRYDPIKIAEMELGSGILPISIRRPLPRKVERRKIKQEKQIEKLEKIEKAEAEAEKADKKEIKEIKKEIEKKAEKEVEKEAEKVEQEIEKATEQRPEKGKEKSDEEKILQEIKEAQPEEEEE